MTLWGSQLFPSDNPWNQAIASAPVAANSSAIIGRIISLQGGDGRLHPDFGQDGGGSDSLYGIPYNVVRGDTQPKVGVTIDAYPDESDLLAAPIPANAVIEGDLQDGPVVGVDNRGDSHLIVYDADNNVVYEFFRASRPGENADGRWHADGEAFWDLKADSFRAVGLTSADAAGLPILPGLVRPDEALPASQGGQGVIDHAIRFTLGNNVILNQYLYPASHTANPGNNNPSVQPPMGARFRLKAGVDISKLSPESRVIAQAMKTYGMILADNGSNFFFTGASASVTPDGRLLTWDDDDIQGTTQGLKSLHFSDFEVVDTTPSVAGLGATGGPAGSSVAITGQGFSGAAGHLQVLFGSTPATNVVVVDDAHVTATVPAGGGTVDVRVQSGVTMAADPKDFEGNIFGYGISAIVASDRFTYAAANRPPVAMADVATTTAGVPEAIAVLDNDSDPDGDVLVVASLTRPANGSATLNADQTITYTPRAGFVGQDGFSYTISDGRGGTSTAAVSIDVRSATAAGPVAGDAGFESVGVGNGFATDPSGSAWAFAGPSGVSGNGSGFTYYNPAAPSGTQVAFLQATGSFSQAIAGWAAGSYTIAFRAAQRGGSPNDQDFRVLVDGVVVGTFRPGSTSYGAYATASFAVAAGSHTVAFRGVDSVGGDNTAFVDDIAIAAATQAPPAGPVAGDAGFESVGVGNGFATDPSGSAWAFAGPSGVSGNGSGFTYYNPAAPSGTQVAFLQATGSFSQAIAGWAAGSYTIAFRAAQRGGSPNDQDFRVLVDGVVVGTFRPGSTSYGAYATASFAVAAGSHTVAFRGVDSVGGDNTAFVDDIAIAAAS